MSVTVAFRPPFVFAYVLLKLAVLATAAIAAMMKSEALISIVLGSKLSTAVVS